ncbi:hypothetical protein [Microbulbifer elongatus]|uniref:hypothetical protein n=1 Tax=Microbulbifer elongatus TaxID=86173 RepID=UPI001E348844|nr:hypothetical protein [Microbulbifer elongatus]
MPKRLVLPGVDSLRIPLLAGMQLVLCLCLVGCDFSSDSGSIAPNANSSSSSGGSRGSSSSSSGGSGAEMTGVFLHGQVQGLYYETPSFSGLTDADGRYRYREGEEIRFALGGIELGTALGAPELTPFHLGGGDPLTDEADLRAALEDHQRVDALDIATNMMRLFMILDRDQDPANGIDLSEWDAELQDYRIDLAFDLYAFPYRRGLDSLPAIKSRFDIRYQLPLDAPLLYLYDILGIVVPILVPLEENRDVQDNGTIEQRLLWWYTDLGLPREIRYTLLPEETDRWQERVDYRYDDLGRVVFLRRQTDTNEDGSVDFFYTSERFYNDNNFLVEVLEQDGRLVEEERRRYTFDYDDGSNLVLFLFEQDANFNGVIDTIFAVESLYNDDGLLRWREAETDLNANGVIERRLRFEYFYNDDGHPLEVVETEDDGASLRADGIVDRRRDVAYRYGSNERLLRETVRLDDNGDGQVDRINTYEFFYRSDGRLYRQEWTFDVDADGNPNSRRTFEYRYNSSDLLFRVEMTLDNDDDGIAEAREVTDYLYNDRGQLRETTIETFNGADERQGLLSIVRRYGRRGELVDWYREGEGVTGTTNTPIRLGWRYREIDDGLRYLVHHFRYRQPAFVEQGITDINFPCVDYRFAEGGPRCAISWPLQWKLEWEVFWKAPGINQGAPVVIRP